MDFRNFGIKLIHVFDTVFHISHNKMFETSGIKLIKLRIGSLSRLSNNYFFK